MDFPDFDSFHSYLEVRRTRVCEITGKQTRELVMEYGFGNREIKCVTVAFDDNIIPVEKEILYKFEWDLSRLNEEREKGAGVHFEYMLTPRYEKNWAFTVPIPFRQSGE